MHCLHMHANEYNKNIYYPLPQQCRVSSHTSNSYIPPWGVVLHIGVGLRPTQMCKTTTPGI